VKPRFISLKTKIIVFLTVILFIIVSAFSFIFQKLHEKQLISDYQQHFFVLAETIKNGLHYSMLKNQRETIPQIIKVISKNEETSNIYLANHRGEAVFSSDYKNSNFNCRVCHKDVLRQSEFTQKKTFVFQEDKSRIMWGAIHINNEKACYKCHPQSQKVLGVLTLGLPLIKMDKSLNQQNKNLILLSLLMFVGSAFGIIFLFNFLIAAPLKKLAAGMAEIAKGNKYYKIKITSNDEIGDLAFSFNKMQNKLVSREEALEKTNIELAKANELKSNFLSMTSHELKTPLTSILGYVNLFLDGSYGEPSSIQKERLEVILRNGRNLLYIISNLLDSAQIESGKIEYKFENFSLFEILQQLLEELKILAKEKNIQINISNQIKSLIFADKPKMMQILRNLLLNAIKYNIKNGKIEIALEENEKEFTIKIEDTGIGIKDEDKPFVFDRFRRGKGSGVSGSGLGLAIVKDLVEGHSGKIYFESEFGKGSEFIFIISRK
jgi:signal transduction histidine kinase